MLKCYIGGTFDVLHAGHVNLINKVISMGFHPCISINSDEFVKAYKGVSCVFNETERFKAVRELYPEATILITDKDNQDKNILRCGVSMIVVGTDWMKPEILGQLGINEDFLRRNNISMLFIPRFTSISTSLIKERLKV
jgi:cytidyltransferase-like protein